MSRLFILVSENLTQSRRLNIDEAVSEMESSSREDHKFRDFMFYCKIREELTSCNSGTIFELEYHPQTNAPTSVLTVIDIE